MDVISHESGFRWTGKVETPDATQHTLVLQLDAVAIVAGWISGRVRDGTGRPLAAVEVRATSAPSETGHGTGNTVTDVDGLYRMQVPPGTYRTRVDAENLELVSRTIEGLVVRSGDELRDIDFDLEAGGVIRGRVVDTAGNPLSVVWVFMADETGGSGSRSGGNGEFERRAVSPGRRLVGAYGDFHVALEEVEVEVLPGAAAEIELVMTEARSVAIRVVDGTESVPQAQVSVTGPLDRVAYHIEEEGLHLLGHLPLGTYHASVVHGERRQEVTFSVGEEKEFVVIEVELE